jgi:hypothetical protein
MSKFLAISQMRYQANKIGMLVDIIYVEDYKSSDGKGLMIVRFIAPGFKDIPNTVRQQTVTNAIGIHMQQIVKHYDIIHESFTSQELKALC